MSESAPTLSILYLSGPPSECRTSLHGLNYTGAISQTRSGITCQLWGKNSPHEHDLVLPESEGNFCRNPDVAPFGPWCYTVDRNVRWGYCDIPYCDGKIAV